jgi:hypothetical protein
VPTSSVSSAPPASGSSWKIPKTTKSGSSQNLTSKADVDKVKGRTNLNDNKPDDWASSSSNKKPCVSGANAFPICEKRKKAVNADPPICRKVIIELLIF